MDNKELRIWQNRAEILFRMHETGESEQETQRTESVLRDFLGHTDGAKEYLRKNLRTEEAVPAQPGFDMVEKESAAQSTSFTQVQKHREKTRPMLFVEATPEDGYAPQEDGNVQAKQEKSDNEPKGVFVCGSVHEDMILPPVQIPPADSVLQESMVPQEEEQPVWSNDQTGKEAEKICRE